MTKSKYLRSKIQLQKNVPRCEACGIAFNSVHSLETEPTKYHNRDVCAYCCRIWKKDETKWLHREVTFDEFVNRIASTTILNNLGELRLSLVKILKEAGE